MANIKIGETVLEIVGGETVQAVQCDLMTEARVLHGTIIAISFASATIDGDGKPCAQICARVRLPLTVAMDLRAILDGQLQAAMPGKENAN